MWGGESTTTKTRGDQPVRSLARSTQSAGVPGRSRNNDKKQNKNSSRAAVLRYFEAGRDAALRP